MLKLYKTTIVASTFTAFFACIISIMCECIQFPHALLVQNYAVGISCSLVVVIITTVLQYSHEHKRVFDAYCSSLRDLVFCISIAFPSSEDNEDPSNGFYNYLFEKLDSAFKLFEKNNRDLFWFSKNKKKLQEDVYMCYAHLWIDFERQRFESAKACIEALENHPKFIPLINACIAIFPDGLGKDSFEAEYKDIVLKSVSP